MLLKLITQYTVELEISYLNPFIHLQLLLKLCIFLGIGSMKYSSHFWPYSIISQVHLPLFLVAATRASRMATVGQSIAQKVPLPRALLMRPENFAYNDRITKTYSSIYILRSKIENIWVFAIGYFPLITKLKSIQLLMRFFILYTIVHLKTILTKSRSPATSISTQLYN